MTVETVLTSVPIDIDRFDGASEEELGEPTNAERVVRFLFQHDDKAFTPSEIADAAGVTQSSIGTVLRRLEERSLVRHKGDYWTIGDPEHVRGIYRFHQIVDDLDERAGEEDVEEWRVHTPGEQ